MDQPYARVNQPYAYQYRAPIGGIWVPLDQSNHDLLGAYVTFIYCDLSMKINTSEKMQGVLDYSL